MNRILEQAKVDEQLFFASTLSRFSLAHRQSNFPKSGTGLCPESDVGNVVLSEDIGAGFVGRMSIGQLIPFGQRWGQPYAASHAKVALR